LIFRKQFTVSPNCGAKALTSRKRRSTPQSALKYLSSGNPTTGSGTTAGSVESAELFEHHRARSRKT
jgi:hypothetical protein